MAEHPKPPNEPQPTQAVTSPANGAPLGTWTRRDFLERTSVLLGGSAGAVAATTGTAAWASSAKDSSNTSASTSPRIRGRVRLGETGLEVPDISFGTFSLDRDEALVAHALDRGITHFDTAEGYRRGLSEEVLGRALAGRRHEVTITSKFWTEADHDADRQMRELEASLRRLRTDYVDIYLNHNVNAVARIANPEWHAFIARAKEQGKIRFSGVSGHTNKLVDCLKYGLDQDAASDSDRLLDVILVAYNFAQQPSFKDRIKQTLSELAPSLDLIAPQRELPGLLDRAHRQGVGVMTMKTLKGARLNDMRRYEAPGRTFAQSAFRWILSDPSVDALVVSMTSRAQIDEYIEASGSSPPDMDDLALLSRYLLQNVASQCVQGCNDCATACPAGVETADLMRIRMYDEDYGLPETAREEYARLAPNGSACLSCTGAPCAGSCPVGLPIAALNRDTHTRLTT